MRAPWPKAKRSSRAPLILTRLEHARASAGTIATELGARRDGVWRAIRFLELRGCVRRAGTHHPGDRSGPPAILWEVVP
jgi:predicted ArsR family transcriptional regulator